MGYTGLCDFEFDEDECKVCDNFEYCKDEAKKQIKKLLSGDKK